MRKEYVLLGWWYTIVADIQDYRVDFIVYKIKALDETIEHDCPFYQKSEDMNGETTSVLQEAQIFLHGFVKWDGCSNWCFDQQDIAMIHCCSKEDLLNIGNVMAKCWEIAEEHCPNFDRD